jgi:hypothetical protein
MKQHLLLFLTALLSFNCYSQIEFEKGYFIDNEDQKVDVLIRNVDWRSNPSEFEYRLSPDGESKNATLRSVKEFGIYDVVKYIRHTVGIDRSGGNINNLSQDRNPQFNKEEHFLKILVEGKASLYSLQDGNTIRYFYNKDNSEVTQLIFKKYLTPEKDIATNDGYKQQLWNDLKCSAFTRKKVAEVGYKKREMISFFEDYNECHEQDYITYEEKLNRYLFNLSIRPGMNYSSFSIQNSSSSYKDTDFDKKLGFRLGLEAEFIMPFNKNKWAIIIEPTYQYFKSEQSKETRSVSGGILISRIDYKSVELPIGVRHYFYLNDKSKLFLNLSYVTDFASNSTLEFYRQDNSLHSSLDVKTRGNIAAGVGFKFKDTFGIELRYNTRREILGDYAYWSSDYKTVSMILGYSLF